MTQGPFRVLMLETIDDGALAELQAGAEIVEAWGPDADPGAIAGNGPVHAVVTRGKGRVTPPLLDACAGLRVVARCGVGLDNVDVPAATARSVMVLNLPGSNARTIAEHTIMLVLAVTRGLVECAAAVRNGDWASRTRFDRDEAAGRTLGVVGFGNVGARVAAMGEALGLRVVFCDPHRGDDRFERVDFPTLLGRADIVTLHCPLDASTDRLLDAAALDRMTRGAVLINTARGGLVDHAALAERLRSGALAGYGADVLDVEPPPADHPLVGLPNVVLTPHVGSLTRATYRELCVRSVRNVLAVLRGEAPEPGCVFNARELGSG